MWLNDVFWVLPAFVARLHLPLLQLPVGGTLCIQLQPDVQQVVVVPHVLASSTWVRPRCKLSDVGVILQVCHMVLVGAEHVFSAQLSAVCYCLTSDIFLRFISACSAHAKESSQVKKRGWWNTLVGDEGDSWKPKLLIVRKMSVASSTCTGPS